DILNGDIAELPPEYVLLVLFDGCDVTAHNIQDLYILPVKNFALQQAQNLNSVLTLNKEREEREQLVVQTNEFVPDIHTLSQRALIGFEGLLAEVTRFQRGLDCLGAKSGAVHGDADSRREDGIDKAGRIANHQETITAELVHDIAVITFRLEIIDTHRIGHRPCQALVGLDVGIEVTLRLGLKLLKDLAFRHHPHGRDPVGDRNLPGPASLNRQEVDVDIIGSFRVLAALDVFEPAMNRILVKDFIVLFQTKLAPQQGLPAAGIHDDPAGDVNLLS